MEQNPKILDPRLQSIDGIIGYLDQSLKTTGETPRYLVPIVLFLAKEIKNIKDLESKRSLK